MVICEHLVVVASMMLVFSKVNHKRSIRVRRTREPGFDTDSDSVRNAGDTPFISNTIYFSYTSLRQWFDRL